MWAVVTQIQQTGRPGRVAAYPPEFLTLTPIPRAQLSLMSLMPKSGRSGAVPRATRTDGKALLPSVNESGCSETICIDQAEIRTRPCHAH